MPAHGRFLHAALFAACLAGLFALPSRAAEIRIVAHVHTPVGGGRYSPEELAGMLAQEGLDGAIFTERDRLEVEWGLPLFRHFARYRYERPSITTEGAARYADAIRSASERFPDLLLLPGIESNPYYRIDVDPFALRVRVSGLHEHIVAFGLPVSDLVDAPSVANGFHPEIGRWPVAYGGALLVMLAAAGVAFRRGRPVRLRALRLRPRRVWPLALLTIVAGLALVDRVALRASVFHPYAAEDPGAAPFQRFIDWVGERGGLTFWAHPAVNETIRRGPVEVVTRPYFAHLAETDRYDGLSGLDKSIIGPGGLWDRLLGEHCAGRRERAPWFLAQADFRSGPSRQLWYAVNHVTVPERSEPALLEALRAGRFYTTHSRLGRRWRLGAFRAEAGEGVATSGGRLESASSATVVIVFEPLVEKPPPLQVRVVGSGTTVLDRWINGRETIRVEEPAGTTGCRWYRVLAGRSTKRVHLMTNPIFVRPPRPDLR